MAFPWGEMIQAGASLIAGNQGSAKSWIPEAAWPEQLFQMQNPLTRVIEDARDNQIHPLFAMGSPTQMPSFSVGGVGKDRSAGIAAAGEAVGRAFRTKEQRELERLTLEEMGSRATRNFAEASYYQSLAMRNTQAERASAPAPDVVVGAYRDGARGLESHPLYKDALKLEPDPMTSRSGAFSGQTAGRDHPGMRQFELPGGYKILLPATQGGGVPEEFDASMIPLIVGANLERYGWRWIVDSMGYVTGSSPDDRRGRTVESFIRRLFQ